MIGQQYWSVGIIVRAEPSTKNSTTRRWGAYLDYLDSGFADDDVSIPRISTKGRLETRYLVESTGDQTDSDVLRAIVDMLIADANRLGIAFKATGGGPHVYYHGSGEDPRHEAPPNWRDLIREQNERLGWIHPYVESVQEGQSR